MKIADLIIIILLTGFISCKQNSDNGENYMHLENEFKTGNFLKLKALADSIKTVCPGDKELIAKSDSILHISERIELDFQLSESMVDQQLNERLGPIVSENKAEWEKKNWLEWKVINGEKRYFSRAMSNLNLLRSFHQDRSRRDSMEAADPEIVYRKKHTQSIIKASESSFEPVIPVNMKISYSITVDPDVVPAGEIVRCWMPFPKENHQRQKNIMLLSASSRDFFIAADTSVHRTIYMESIAEKGLPVIFNATFSYQSSGQYFDAAKMKVIPYNKNSPIYRRFTSEQLPHICFTENVKRLADSIAGNEEDPLKIVREIYYWFTRNIPWTGALEYSTIPNIPEYVIQNMRGDCGMQTFLMMSMLRYKGIPVKWQSGWMVPPAGKNLHDWCEVYVEGTGWIPLDVSYGLQYSDNRKTKEFYISGIDSYRLIVNDGISGRLYPEKKYLRSEPFDFQRGEVEWSGGNLYYDKWDYNMEIIYN